MRMLEFVIPARGYNQVLNGLQYYVDKSGDETVSDVLDAIAEICVNSFLRSNQFSHESGDVFVVTAVCSEHTMGLIWILSDWFGAATSDDEYSVDYAAKLVDKYNDAVAGLDASQIEAFERREAKHVMFEKAVSEGVDDLRDKVKSEHAWKQIW